MKRVRFSHSPAPRGSSKANGECHVRYHHTSSASIIDIVCPTCGHRAVASCVPNTLSNWPGGTLLGGGWVERKAVYWAKVCTHCTFRSESTCQDNITPFYWDFDAAGCRVWAWNREHLQMLLKVLQGESIAGDVHEWFRTYVRREWLLRQNRLRIAKEIVRRLGDESVKQAGPPWRLFRGQAGKEMKGLDWGLTKMPSATLRNR